MPAAAPAKAEMVENNEPLAGLPSAPGAHLAKIKALADNTWLDLGSPAADPKWGKGRGRSWSSRMAYAPDLKAAFLFGEGVHGWWNRQNNRYMDDLFVYDIMAHRWVCAYPGTDVMNVDLKLDKNGFEVDENGADRLRFRPETLHVYARFQSGLAGGSLWQKTPGLGSQGTGLPQPLQSVAV
jgi:hypothetical protein